MEENGTARYVVFEGPDGAGKTTLSRAVVAALQQAGVSNHQLLVQNFPSSVSAPGQLIRRAFRGEETVGEKAMAYLMLADAVEVDARLWEHYQKGGYVIVDHHALVSGWVYQTEVYGLHNVLALQLRDQFLYPEFVFILDIPTDVMEERIQARAEQRNTMYEKKDRDYQERLRQRYIAYAIMHRHHAVVLDGTLPTEVLVKKVLDRMALPPTLRADNTLRGVP